MDNVTGTQAIDLEKASRAVFSQLSDTAVPVPLYLRQRVLARLQERRQWHTRIRLWIAVSVLNILVCVGVFLRSSHPIAQMPQAISGIPVAVHVDVQELNSDLVEYAEATVPDGVRFYGGKNEKFYPATVKLKIVRRNGRSFFPLVVQASAPGVRAMQIKFFDKKGVWLATREIQISFRKTL